MKYRIKPLMTLGRNALLISILAVPIFASSVPGINNFYKVDDEVYRGAQPSQAGFRYLAKIGVRTVIDLREADSRSRAEQKLVAAAGLKYINVPMSWLTPPTQAQIDRILTTLRDSAAEPVFVHCMRGADRTGAVIAAYRIDHDGWDNVRALQEAKDRGMSFFQLPRERFIRDFQARRIGATGVEAHGFPEVVRGAAQSQGRGK